MGRKLWEKLRRHRGLVYALMDIFLLAVSFAVVAAFHGTRGSDWLNPTLAWVFCASLISIFLRLDKLNHNIWRYAGAREYLSLINSYAAGFTVFFLLNKLLLKIEVSELLILLSVILALTGSLYIRATYRVMVVNMEQKNTKGNKRRYLAIIGAGNTGSSLLNEISRNPYSPYTVWGFFDDDLSKIGMNIGGIPVRGTTSNMPEVIKNSPVHDLVLCIPTLSVERRREIIELCSHLQCQLKIMPDTLTIMEQSTDNLVKSMRPVKIEDLLGRTEVRLTGNELDTIVHGKTILVSGGGGSIGSEIVRQVVHAGVSRLVIFDINENDSYILYRELKPMLRPGTRIFVEIGSMTDKRRVKDIFEQYQPDVVFHAAAHKHVPLMEYCPYEAVQNNVLGTYNMMMAAKAVRCKKFVLISTDKAVNPTNIMGATKRYCENMVHAIAQESDNKTTFVAVRFGNVLGSHGSVIPLFQMQIAQGGPVTVTDKRMTRYFMTIPEAAGLVIHAGAMAQSSETYVLDMGKPVKILDLAENLVRLSGFEPYSEIDIVETGLRPGEKLYEELLVNDENHIATSNSRIFIERNDTNITMSELQRQLRLLESAIAATDNRDVIRLMREFVPNYKSPEDVNAALGAVSVKQDEVKEA